MSVLTQKANPPCRWTPAYSQAAHPPAGLMAIAKSSALNALPVNVVAVADVAAANAMKPVNAMSNPGQKAVVTP